METLVNNNKVNSVELLKGQYRTKVLELFGLGTTLKDMRSHFPDVRLRNKTFNDTVREIVGDDTLQSRYSQLLSDSQLGTSNTMSERYGISHPRYVSVSKDGHGYLTVRTPRWWNADKKADRTFLHHFIYCTHNMLDRVPEGYVIHHVDCDKSNNSIRNLLLCTASQHSLIHAQLKQNITTISKESTPKWVEAPCPYCT